MVLPEKNPGISTWCLIAWQITRTATAPEITSIAGHALSAGSLVVATGVVTILLTAVVPKIMNSLIISDTRYPPQPARLLP